VPADILQTLLNRCWPTTPGRDLPGLHETLFLVRLPRKREILTIGMDTVESYMKKVDERSPDTFVA
jgi:hypothetical protein